VSKLAQKIIGLNEIPGLAISRVETGVQAKTGAGKETIYGNFY
jgi:hypothetical protein